MRLQLPAGDPAALQPAATAAIRSSREPEIETSDRTPSTFTVCDPTPESR